jgi:predicted nucleic acid-binding Zn ribbon protein
MPVYGSKGGEAGTYDGGAQGFHGAPGMAHPGTGGPWKRGVTLPAIIFKGSGWHVKDYAKKGSEKSESSEKKE